MRLLFITTLMIFSQIITRSVSADAFSDNVDRMIRSWMQSDQVPGVALAISNRGKDYFFEYGWADVNSRTPVTRSTIFELASVSKVFASSLLAWEVSENHLDLNRPIYTYFQELKDADHSPISQVTFLHLATHTAGFPRSAEQLGVRHSGMEAKNLLLRRLAAWHPESTIGTRFLYSNIGFGFLGQVLEKVSGRSFESLLQERMLIPLGMTSTFVTVPKEQYSNYAQGYDEKGLPAPHYDNVPIWPAGGGLRSNILDMMKFLKVNLTESGHPSLAWEKAMRLSHQEYFHAEGQPTRMGLGWGIQLTPQGRLLSKNGINQGFNCEVLMKPDSKTGVVILTNKRGASSGKIARQILTLIKSI